MIKRSEVTSQVVFRTWLRAAWSVSERPPAGLFVVLAFRRFPSQFVRDDQALDLRPTQLAPAFALSAQGELVGR